MATAHMHRGKRQRRQSTQVHSKKHSVLKSIFGEIDKTKEYTIYWLHENTTLLRTHQEIPNGKLRGIVDYLRNISDINDIVMGEGGNIFLIVDSESLNKHFARLAECDQIQLIYVYNKHDDNENQKNINELFIKCSKVRGLFKDIDELFPTLSKNVRTMTSHPNLVNELPALTSASKTVERSTSASYSYVTDWYINLIRTLQDVPPARDCKEKFVEECRILYKHNSSILKTITEFNNTYVPEDAIRWYTRDGFLYKVLNKILREQNQQGIQLLHFLIYDLNAQLKTELRTKEQDWMKADAVRLYRGQLMSIEELQQLQKNKGEQLFVNSFMSMTTDLAVAKMFSGAGDFGSDDPTQSVIFHIEWANDHPKEGIADIHRISFNEDEGEILLSPTYTINLLSCIYDENERVWNAIFSRIIQMDNPLVRINDDECLMRLELTLRYLIAEKDTSIDDIDQMSDTSSEKQEDEFEFTTKFCSTFVEDVPNLLRELELPEFCSITLNDDNSGRFQLKALKSFATDSLDHGPKIHDEMIVTLYDALGSVFKTKGNLMKAYYYYQKASIYDKPQSQTTYTRQAHLAQIHKMDGSYELSWNIFDELMKRTDDEDTFLYNDIAFARSTNMSDQVYLQNSKAFLQYCSFDDDHNDDDGDDDDDDQMELFGDEWISHIIEAWAELGYKYFYQIHDVEQALECYTREKELSLAASKSPCFYFNPLIGSWPERMADISVSMNATEKALTLYEEARDLAQDENFVINHLVHGYGKPYTRDTSGKCYVHLSRSLQRCERYQLALKYAKQAISIFLPDPLLLEKLIDNCSQLIIELHRSINGDTVNLPTEEEIIKNRQSLNDEELKNMLQTTLEELKNEIDNK